MKIAVYQTLVLTAALLFAMPGHACRPFGSYQFAEDKTGGIWFTEGDNNAISRLAPDGSVRAYPLPTPHAEPTSLALDRKGNVWFVAGDAGKVGRLGTDGRIVEYPTAAGHPVRIAVDARGEAWYTQMAGTESGGGDHAGHGEHDHAAPQAMVGRITRTGQRLDYPVASGWPTSIAVDRHGRVWVSVLEPKSGKNEKPVGRLAQLSRDGKWTEIARWDNSCPNNLLASSDGGVMLSDHCRGVVERVAPDGRRKTIAVPKEVWITSLTEGRDGTIWFVNANLDANKNLGRLSRQGRVDYIQRPDNGDQAFAILATRGGDVVFSEFYNYNLNRLKKSGEFVEHLVSVDHRRGAREVKEGEVCRIEFGARIAAKKEMDHRRAEEVKKGVFKESADGAHRLVQEKCLQCHDTRRLLLSRRSDWTPSLTRMQTYMQVRNVPKLTDGEMQTLVRYFNGNYSLAQ